MTEYGQKIQGALNAVVQLHKDTSKLLVDFDKQMLGFTSVFGNFATSELTYHVKAEGWLASGVYRYYTKEGMPGLVDGVMVPYLDPRLTEPMLVVADLQYQIQTGIDIKQVCKPWDIWYLYFDWSGTTSEGEIVTHVDAENGRIARSRLKAVPLYSIRKIEDVKALLDEVRRV